MRNKDYGVIASTIQEANRYNKQLEGAYPATCMAVGYQRFAKFLANNLEQAGYKFDRQEFLAACGIDTGFEPSEVEKRVLRPDLYSLEQDIKEVAELEAKLDSDPDWRAQSATDNRECWTCHKAVSVCGHSQPV